MNVMVQMRLQNTEGALERVLGKMRFRGIKLSKLLVDTSEDGDSLEVTCKLLDSPRLGPFSKQLRQMLDVENLEIYGALAKAQ